MCDPDTCTTNGLRRGTQFGVPAREELVTACVECRGGRGSGEILRARPWREFQNVHVTARIGTPSVTQYCI